MDHDAQRSDDPEVQFSKQHEVYLTENGKFEKLAGTPTIEVNSLHTQGIDKIANDLLLKVLLKTKQLKLSVYQITAVTFMESNGIQSIQQLQMTFQKNYLQVLVSLSKKIVSVKLNKKITVNYCPNRK